MRSEIAQRIIEQTPAHTKRYVDKVADITVIVNSRLNVLNNHNFPQIQTWLLGEFDWSLESIIELEEELQIRLL